MNPDYYVDPVRAILGLVIGYAMYFIIIRRRVPKSVNRFNFVSLAIFSISTIAYLIGQSMDNKLVGDVVVWPGLLGIVLVIIGAVRAARHWSNEDQLP